LAKKKLVHFEECGQFPHFFQPKYLELAAGFPFKGKWYPGFFPNPSPLTLELGCGKAEYSVFLAAKYPYRNFLAFDQKGARMWKGARLSYDIGLNNIAFIRTLSQNLRMVCGHEEVEEIWIPFPEPHPSKAGERKRLTSPRLLNVYADVLKPGHVIHLKTDNPSFFDYTLDVISVHNHRLLFASQDIYAAGYEGDAVEVKTFYEEIWLKQGAKIHYIQFRLNGF